MRVYVVVTTGTTTTAPVTSFGNEVTPSSQTATGGLSQDLIIGKLPYSQA